MPKMFAFAPKSSSNATIAGSFFHTARWRGELLSLSSHHNHHAKKRTHRLLDIKVSAVLRKKRDNGEKIVENCTMEWCAIVLHSEQTAVHSTLSRALTFAPFSIRILESSSAPMPAVRCNAERLSLQH